MPNSFQLSFLLHRPWSLAALLTTLFCAPLAQSAPRQQEALFVEIPHVQEFTSRMIVRPLQRAALSQMGLNSAEVEQRRSGARRKIQAYRILEYVPQTDEYIIEVPDGSNEGRLAALLMATGYFQYVEPDWMVYPIEPQSVTPLALQSPRQDQGVPPPSRCPDDPLFGTQWHHQTARMRSCEAWEQHTGDPSVSVGICDTGIRTTHEDLMLNRLEGYNAVDGLWESEGGDIGPRYRHGTRTTGVAAANGNNAVGVSGVGWNLSHRMLRVSNQSDGGAFLSDIHHGARTSIESGDRVANVSYHGASIASNGPTATYIKSLGGLMLWSAGNTSSNHNHADRDDDDLIVVGATDAADQLAWFSSYGRFVDLVAPGVDIVTTDSFSDTAYASPYGTSYSCPLTTGVCAMIWSARPNLSPGDVESILKASAHDLGTPGIDSTYGYGRIDLERALTISGERQPEASLSARPTSGRSPLVVEFRDLSTGVPGSWSWDFGDGAASSLQNPVHTYTTSGTYTVSLTVTNSVGTDTRTETDLILVDVIPPVAEFSGSPTAGLAPMTVNFADESTGGIPTAWAWNFGDGGSSTLENPSHTYVSSGFYDVSLTVSNSYGSSDLTRTGYVAVDFIPPAADFVGQPTSGPSPMVVDFSDLSGGGMATAWSWSFGDGGSSTAQHPSHTYTAQGTYTVRLIASNVYGSDTLQRVGYIDVQAGPPILADFVGTPTSGSAPLQVVFTDLSIGNVAEWEWNFGDGGTSFEQHPTHVYTSPGEYDVALAVTTSDGTDDHLERGKYVVVE